MQEELLGQAGSQPQRDRLGAGQTLAARQEIPWAVGEREAHTLDIYRLQIGLSNVPPLGERIERRQSAARQ